MQQERGNDSRLVKSRNMHATDPVLDPAAEICSKIIC